MKRLNPKLISVCGVHKAGTTQLYRLISSHNLISGSSPKQPKYLYEDDCKNQEIYFEKCKFDNKKKIYLDANPDFFFDHTCRDKIIKLFTNNKIIISLRNPIDRCFSHWSMIRKNLNKKEFILGIKSKNNLYAKSLYSENIRFFIENFNKKNLLIIFFEEWSINPIKLKEQISDFLNIDNNFNFVFNKSNSAYNSILLRKIIMNKNFDKIKNFIPNNTKTFIRNYLTYVGIAPKLNIEERLILAKIFQSDVQKLKKLITIPGDIWNDF